MPAIVRSSIEDLTLVANQTMQIIEKTCSNLEREYQVIFPRNSRNHYILSIHAEGPCADKDMSTLKIDIEIHSCSCPPGFMPQNDTIKCICVCDEKDKLFPNTSTIVMPKLNQLYEGDCSGSLILKTMIV